MMRSLLILVIALLAVSSPAWAQEEEPYRLGPDDAVQVQVWQRPDLTGNYQVDPTGKITLPLLGKIEATGLTAEELGTELERRYVILDPRVSEVLVTVIRYGSQYLTVVGEVRNPGRYSFRTMPNLWDALLAAGGAIAGADLGKIQIVRRGPEGEQQSIAVDLSEGIENIDLDSLPELKTGDSIIVPASEQNLVTGDLIQVLGAVRTPGLYSLRAADTVVEAVAVSGGAAGNADLDRVTLTRRTPGGAVVYRLDVEGYLYAGHPVADLPLQAGDTITIPARSGGLRSVLGTVFSIAPILSAVASILVLSRN